MNTDNVFYIGKDHQVNEDYALSGVTNGLAYAIVCDGCSASTNVDFGARILALTARENVVMDMDKDPYEFGGDTIKKAYETAKRFALLHPQCLDATLLVAWVFNNNLNVYMYGDGVMVHRNKEGIKMAHIHLTSGAPDYLSYILDYKRIESYNKLEDNRKEVWTSFNGIHDYKPFVPFTYKCAVEDGDVISVISDGINSFRKADNEAIDWKDLVNEFTEFKNFEGQFVLRRVSAFKRKIAKDNWHHLDDISIASICV
jgi:serine/threonine protein phosphatase PrpC